MVPLVAVFICAGFTYILDIDFVKPHPDIEGSKHLFVVRASLTLDRPCLFLTIKCAKKSGGLHLSCCNNEDDESIEEVIIVVKKNYDNKHLAKHPPKKRYTCILKNNNSVQYIRLIFNIKIALEEDYNTY